MRWNLIKNLVTPVSYLIVIGLIASLVWFSRPYWQPLLAAPSENTTETSRTSDSPSSRPKTLELSQQARANLNLVTAPVKPQSYWRKIQIPGVIEDRPGLTDRGITAPLAGVITQVHAFEGDIIQPGEKLFTIRLVSEYLQQSQSDLFKANREIEILKTEIERIAELIQQGSIPGKRKLELEQQISRQNAKVDALRQDLLSRGLSLDQVGQIQQGNFLSTIEIKAPFVDEPGSKFQKKIDSGKSGDSFDFAKDFFEIQQLKVELGQQVRAGEALAVLANHFSLYIKGYGFKKEASRLASAAEKSWNVDVEFTEDDAEGWNAIEQNFEIRHLSNTTDPNSRTFDFFIPLTNQARTYTKEGRVFVIWRFRPGQRVNILVPVEKFENVLVFPSEAVAIDGPEAFVFQQNGDLFNRLPVQVIHRDRFHVVVKNDGSISPGFYLAQNAAASLTRVLKAQAASGLKPGFHMHADGSVHAAH